MISLERDLRPTRIHANFRSPKREGYEKKLLFDQRKIKQGLIKKHPFDSEVWKKAKPQLKVETGDKCAYCEAPTSLVAYGDVEHYRPKSIYWWLAYNYDNYLVSCQLCNQRFKSDNFPVKNSPLDAPRVAKNSRDETLLRLVGSLGPDPEDAASSEAFEILHMAERPLLLNPYFDDPAKYFAWKADNVLREVELIPNSNEADAPLFVDAANAYYGLNRLELKQARYTEYYEYVFTRSVRDQPGIPQQLVNEAKAQIASKKKPGAAFAGMIRYFDSLPNLPPA